MMRWWVVVLCVAMQSGVARAGEQVPARPAFDRNLLSEGFLAAHPDIRWQREGMESYRKGRHEIALRQFQRAARHGDKVSQAMIATMYWEGMGVARDRPLAYAWMDIAAERLYPDLLAFRERYWDALTGGERDDAVRRGQAVLAEYGDDVAKPRLEAVMIRERRRATGGRVGGSAGNMTIIPFTGPLAGAYGVISLAHPNRMTVRGDEYYADQYWKPQQYWTMKDRMWEAGRSGRVDASELQPVRAEDTEADSGEDSP